MFDLEYKLGGVLNKARFGLIATLSALAVGITTAILAPAYAVPDYPTAAEVAAAKRDVQEKQKSGKSKPKPRSRSSR